MFSVSAINAFNDNYIWIITASITTDCYLVDPGDAGVCINYIEQHQLTLRGILITHHHRDHTGGIEELKNYCVQQHWPLTVFGPESKKIAAIDSPLNDGDAITLFDHIQLTVMAVPGHTLDHIAFYGNNTLFCGDTLFSGGCGRLFEGTPKQMLLSLNKFKRLPTTTKIYCAHEYTQANLTFALAVEPKNSEIITYQRHVMNTREQNLATIPTNLATELAINPFLRSDSDEIKLTLQQLTNQQLTSELEVFTATRHYKDNF